MRVAERFRFVAVCGLILVSVVAVYAQVAGHSFLEYDDGLYITENQNVRQGLTPRTVFWALFTTDAFIWHPLTWLSYLLDSDLYGVESAGPWLLTNVAWHVASAWLLLAALVSLTGRFWSSAFVAALFALHPIQTEAVAWASGRKEVLGGFFSMLTLWCYARYAHRKRSKEYLAVVVSMLLCMMAKGTQVALPFLLLLLDYWPLGRMGLAREPGPKAGAEPFSELVLEKLPLFLLALATILIQFFAVSATLGPWPSDPPLFERILDGVMAYVATLGRLFWPDGLAIVYPTPVQMGLPRVPAAHVGLALTALTLVTALAAAAGRRRGHFLVGWLWFLGMLFPMLGLVPAGLRVMHDRYAYVPMIGIAIAIGFGSGEILARLRVPRAVSISAATALLGACAFLSWNQVGFWRDSTTLFGHALEVTERNAVVHQYMGNTFAAMGDFDQARREFEAALSIRPDYPDANNSLGRIYVLENRGDLAIPYLRRALAARPAWTEAMTDLGEAQWLSGKHEAALATFRAAVAMSPESAEAHSWLASALAEGGLSSEAAVHYREALRLDPDLEAATQGLATLESSTR